MLKKLFFIALLLFFKTSFAALASPRSTNVHVIIYKLPESCDSTEIWVSYNPALGVTDEDRMICQKYDIPRVGAVLLVFPRTMPSIACETVQLPDPHQ